MIPKKDESENEYYKRATAFLDNRELFATKYVHKTCRNYRENKYTFYFLGFKHVTRKLTFIAKIYSSINRVFIVCFMAILKCDVHFLK